MAYAARVMRGLIIDNARQRMAHRAEARAALKGSSVTAAEAARAAAAKGTVTELDLDGDDRTPVWDVDTTGANGAQSEWHVGLDRATVTADRSSDDD